MGTELKKEFRDIVEGAIRNLELMRVAGISGVPLSSPDREALKNPEEGVWVSSIGLPDKKGEWEGVAFSAWRLGNILFIEGSAVSSGINPFSSERTAQIERLIGWVGEKLGIKPEAQPFSCHSIKEGRAGSLQKGVEKAALLIKGRIKAASPSVIVALGPLASSLLLGRPDTEGLAGRFHELNGVKLMPTHDSISLLKDQGLKKETMAHMLSVIKLFKDSP
ncbi:MAG: hypothetical protein Q7T24_06195 [Deltaproteobacteria bacterium]|nr:hypothetical protein [Deltaproteobacteria bacterium]